MKPLAVLALILVCLPAVAGQNRSLMPFGLMGKTLLLTMNEVKKELKLTKEQGQKIEALLKQAQEDPAATGGIPDMHYMTRALDKKAVTALDEGQQARLQQLFLQANGLLTLSEPEVASALGLSDDALAQAKTVIKAFDREQMNAMMDVQKTKRIDQKKLDAMRDKAEAELAALLTSDQASTWKVLLGETFKFPKGRR